MIALWTMNRQRLQRCCKRRKWEKVIVETNRQSRTPSSTPAEQTGESSRRRTTPSSPWPQRLQATPPTPRTTGSPSSTPGAGTLPRADLGTAPFSTSTRRRTVPRHSVIKSVFFIKSIQFLVSEFISVIVSIDLFLSCSKIYFCDWNRLFFLQFQKKYYNFKEILIWFKDILYWVKCILNYSKIF